MFKITYVNTYTIIPVNLNSLLTINSSASNFEKGGDKMEVKQIISKSKEGNRMEVIAKDDSTLQTLHIHRKNNIWRYFVYCDKKGNKVFSVITI